MSGRTQQRLTPQDLAARVGAVLDELREVHEGLLAVTLRQREAMRAADPARVRDATREQAELAARLRTLEARRNQLVSEAVDAGLARRSDASAKSGPVTLRDLAAACPSSDRQRLTDVATRLRALMERVALETRTTRAATVTLLAHVEGVLRQVAGKLSHTGTYSRRGTVDAGVAVVSALDLRQ
jgi:hypothetical protein